MRANHSREVPVIETDGRLHTRRIHRVSDRTYVVSGQSDRLLDPEMLAGLRNGDTDLAMQRVGCRDTDDVDARIVEQLAPVEVYASGAVPTRKLLGLCRHSIGNGHQVRGHRQIREVVADPYVRAGVDLSHPAGTDDAHADGRQGTGRRLLGHALGGWCNPNGEP